MFTKPFSCNQSTKISQHTANGKARANGISRFMTNNDLTTNEKISIQHLIVTKSTDYKALNF